MSDGAAQVRKLCFRCGDDVSVKARTKDARGRYFCATCENTERGARGVAPVNDEDEPADLLTPTEDHAVEVIELAEEGWKAEPVPEPVIQQPVVKVVERDGVRECPGCSSVLGTGAVVCMRCGLNLMTGKNIGAGSTSRAAKKCVKCGYDMVGAPTVRCPECGTVNLKKASRVYDAEMSKQVAREEIRKPLLMMAIGLPIVFVGAWVSDGTVVSGVLEMVNFAITLPVAALAFFLISWWLIGFDEPMWTGGMKIAGVYAVFGAARVVMQIIPIPILWWALPMFLLVGMLMETFEMEFNEAVVLAFVIGGIKFLATVGLMYIAVQQGWI